MLKGRKSGHLAKPLSRLVIEPLEDRNLLNASPIALLPFFPLLAYRTNVNYSDNDADLINRPGNDLTQQHISSSRDLPFTSTDSTDALFRSMVPSVRSTFFTSFDTSLVTFNFVILISHDPASNLSASSRLSSRAAMTFQKGLSSELPDADDSSVRVIDQDMPAGQAAVSSPQVSEQMVHNLMGESEIVPMGFFAPHNISAATAQILVRGVDGPVAMLPAARLSGAAFVTDHLLVDANVGTAQVAEKSDPSTDPIGACPTEKSQPSVPQETVREALDLACFPASQGSIADGLLLGVADLHGAMQGSLEPMLLASSNPYQNLFWWGLTFWLIAVGFAGEYLRRRMDRLQFQSHLVQDWFNRESWQGT